MNTIKGTTRLTGLLGYPVTYTFSPPMQNAAFAALGLDYVYLPLPVRPEHLEAAVQGIRVMNFVGFNVTIPFKERIKEYLDQITTEAEIVGAVNVVKITEERLVGYNTDTYGFQTSLKEEADFELEGKTIWIVGAGGAGRALAGMAALAGARKLCLTDIVEDKLEGLARDLRRHFPQLAIECVPPGGQVEDAQLVANATPLGMNVGDPSPVSEEAIPRKVVAFDCIYTQPLTPFLRAAEQRGCRTLNGVGMLIHQGARAFELWTGVAPPRGVMRQVLEPYLKG